MANKLSFEKLPNHVGIIMDGNGRWATFRGHKRSFGHKAGAKRVVEVVKTFFDCGVNYLSLYAFSTENFSRPKQEVECLFSTLKKGLKRYGEECIKYKARFTVSGDISVLDNELQAVINEYVCKTQEFSAPVLNICLNYGARQELCRAFNLMSESAVDIASPEIIENYLYGNLPALDLIIRTGGEQRLSNFMLWHACYAELYFTDILWPDFTKEECLNALKCFSTRKRRFGNVENA